MLSKRRIVVAVLLLALVCSVGANSSTSGPQQFRLAPGFGRATLGDEAPVDKPVAGIADLANLPTPQTASAPTPLELTKAPGGLAFDVRALKSTVVRLERPEDAGPADDDAAEVQPAKISPRAIAQQALANTAPAPPPDSSFAGLDFANWGAGHPPDTNGDVGPTYYIQTINSSIGIYDKSTGSRVAAFTFNAFMSQGNFGNLCDTNNFGDPVVLYDTFENRWFVTDFAFALDGSGNVNPQHVFQCFAVSRTGDPVAGGWNFYSIEAPGGLDDYPKFGVWPDGIYMSANMFGYAAGASYIAPHVWALNKQQMYAGAASPQVVDFTAPSADFTVIPANARLQTGTPPAGTPEYFTSTEEFLNAQTVYKFHVDWDKISTSTFTGPDIPLASTCWPAATPTNAPTTANAADVLPIRAMAQTQYSNIGGAESLWVSHTVQRGEAPSPGCGAITGGSAAPRWYQINVTGGTVAANDVQNKTWDPDGANTFYRFMPALAVDRAGDMAIGYSKSNSTTNPQIKYAGRLAGDPINTFSQGEQTLIDGTGSQSGNCGSSACIRWGDYSGMALDPNGCEFWETNEYYLTTGLNHQTLIGSFHFPGCTTVGNGTLSGTVTDGSNPISGATITLGSRTTTTNGSGNYSFTVPAGTYPTETAAKNGFDTVSAATLVVPDGGTLTKNFTLSAAAQSGCFTDNTQSTFQRGIPNGCSLTASPGNVQLKQNVAVDQQNLSVTNSGFAVNSTSWAGQTFVPAVTGPVTEVDLNLFCSGCTGTTPNLTVSLRATSGGLPTGADLASATIPGFNSGSGGFFAANFASPPTLTAGTQYAIVFRAVSNPSAGTYAYVCSCSPNSNPYANGLRVTSANSGSTWAADTTVGGRDLGFKVIVNQGFPASGTFVSSVKDANPAANRTPQWTTLSFSATTPAGTDVKFQVAASNSSSGPFTYVGPDGTANTFFTTSGASLAQFNGFRYLRYQAYLSTSDPSVTPSLSSAQVCFTDVANTNATTLSVAAATGTYGGTTTLSSTLKTGAQGIPGKSIAFTLNGASAGTATTDASGTATLSNVSLAGIDAGSYPAGVGASFAGDTTNDPAAGSGSLTVARADQTITFGALADRAYTAPDFTVSATASSGLAVSFTAAGTCSVSGSTVHLIRYGSCAITASQAGDGNRNAAPDVTQTFNVTDPVPPVTTATLAPPLHNGWYASPTLTLTGDDSAGGSGVARTEYTLDGGPWTTYTGPVSGFTGGNHVVQYRSIDVAGNVEAVQTIAFKVDAVKPTVTISRPNDGTVYPLDKVVTAAFKCTDKESGLDTCVGTQSGTQSSSESPLTSGVTNLDTSSLGTHTVTVTGTDLAGNVRTATVQYTVVYTWNGFFSPITNESDALLNLVHLGDLIKLGFGLNGDRGLDVLAQPPTSVQVACPAWATHTVSGAGAGTTTGLSYNASSGHYTFGWQTSGSWAGTCRQFRLQTNDGTPPHTAVFMFFQ